MNGWWWALDFRPIVRDADALIGLESIIDDLNGTCSCEWRGIIGALKRNGLNTDLVPEKELIEIMSIIKALLK